MSLLRKSLLAAACTVALAGQASAVHINESFDGAWVDPAAVGNQKGLMVDYIPSANTFFFAFFTYNASGEQLWTVGSVVIQDGVREYGNVPVSVVRGGRFGEAGSPTETRVGTVDLSIQCDRIALGFTPAAGSGLSAAAFTFRQSLGLDSLTRQECNASIASCPAGTTAAGNDCALPNSITNELILPAGKRYVVNGRVSVENGGKLSIAPGVTVVGGAAATAPNFISVKQGGRIYAEGTKEQPITFTGPTPTPGSWAGLVIAGRSICNDGTPEQPCRFEAVPDITYGSTTPVLDDNSGVLRYVRILWAGQQIAPNEELNSLTLLGVGNRTVLEHVQVDGGLDDGFEFFGGSVNGRYLVCSNMGDDCFDFDQGYNGRIQYALGFQGSNPDITTDSNGIESDNDSSNNDKQPRTQPVISNVTLVGAGSVGNEGARIRRGSGGNYSNILITGFRDRCLNLDDAGTFALGTASVQGERLTFTNSFIGQCAGGAFEDAAGDTYPVSGWFAAGAGNGTGDPQLTGFLPAAASPVVSGGKAPADGFFQPAAYRGAFAGPTDNWTKGWTVRLPNQ
jgi:hypothetical protein